MSGRRISTEPMLVLPDPYSGVAQLLYEHRRASRTSTLLRVLVWPLGKSLGKARKTTFET